MEALVLLMNQNISGEFISSLSDEEFQKFLEEDLEIQLMQRKQIILQLNKLRTSLAREKQRNDEGRRRQGNQ